MGNTATTSHHFSEKQQLPTARAEAEGDRECCRVLRGSVELLSLGSLNGASVCAGAAVDALVSVDLVLAVSLVDGLGGAVLCASAAGDAIIANLVCHCRVLRIRICSRPLGGDGGLTDNYITKSYFFKG